MAVSPAKLSVRSQSGQLKAPARSLAAALPQGRILLVWGVLALGVLGLSYRLYQLQVAQGPRLQRQARAQQSTRLQPYIPRRGVIDSLGNVLATDQLMYTLFAHPKYFTPTEKIPDPKAYIARNLAPILGNLSEKEILRRFAEKESGIKLATRLSESQAAKIQSLGMGGLDLEKQYARFYPQEDFAAGIVGYVDGEHQGQAGVEMSQKQILERETPSFSIRQGANRTILPASLPDNLLRSNDWQLQLTLDMRLQRAVMEALQAQAQKYKVKRATAIVMEAQTGEITALANYPSFNPNEYYKAKVEYFKNWAVSDLYEPGSTFKPINVAIALDQKAISANDRLSDPGSVRVGPWTISNASKTGAGIISVTEAIRSSSNVAMVAMVRKMKPEVFYRQLQAIGLDRKTGIDLPGEVSNYLKDKDEFVSQVIEPATASFGQGFSLTPIKLVQLHAALANGGLLVTPHVVRGLVDARQTLHWRPDYPIKKVFTPVNAQAVTKMMETVVDGGTGKAAHIKGYRIGGKTGTAQKAGPRGGYLPNAKIVSFVAILPVDQPRYVVAAIFDEPQGGNTYGGTVAAPVVKQVMESLIAIKGIPPSRDGALSPLAPLNAQEGEEVGAVRD
ncbi:MAG: peptidoglycan D,D-transpeptidase FtsI family protein [Cyanobacteriota bacterium]|jgi:cell division protein FtsI (penicillin-binding protein 3)